MGQLDRWLSRQGLGVSALTSVRAAEFLGAVRLSGRRRVPTMASLAPLLGYLRVLEVVPAVLPVTPTQRDELLASYHRHLVTERGLTPNTVLRYQRFARRFLADRAARGDGELGIEGLDSAAVHDYLLRVSDRLAVASLKREAADLRALLRFLYLAGATATDLGSAMPPVATWRLTNLPRDVTAAQVNALLDSCDRTTVSGRRDRAILVLLARLGLRSGEVAALRVQDVDWRAGEVLVRGKARRQDRLPLPVEVGESLVAYLRDGRPRSPFPQLILTLHAPPRPIHPSSITNVVQRACRRAGLAEVGGHRLRHALATEMLRRGGDLTEIAQVLRQSDMGTTAVYAKVDRAALRTVASPWPGAAR
jgi:site-specific recombinase XerD